MNVKEQVKIECASEIISYIIIAILILVYSFIASYSVIFYGSNTEDNSVCDTHSLAYDSEITGD